VRAPATVKLVRVTLGRRGRDGQGRRPAGAPRAGIG
jgi:hypothetical protein